MKFLFRLFAYGIGVIAAAGAGFAVWLNFTSVSAADLPALKDGDIVFQISGSGQNLAIMAASRSMYSHAGLIEIGAGGQVFVVEAVGPVQTVPLADWIEKGEGGRITVKRMTGLTAAEAKAVLQAAHAYDGKPYDMFFLPGSDAIYCSELVYDAFRDGPNISIGEMQKVRDLAFDNFASRRLIEKRWKKHPLCQKPETANFEACYNVILNQSLVTPASIARDQKLELVFSNFGLAAE